MSKAQLKYRPGAFEAVHSAASGLQAAGALDREAMRGYDAACLARQEITAADIRRLRQELNVSQDVFASYLGTSTSTVKRWESSANSPNPLAQRLLHIIAKHGLGVLE
ncbi:helix-turn-helix domain-containing protein [Oxalobacteraceae bacterium A2-2]